MGSFRWCIQWLFALCRRAGSEADHDVAVNDRHNREMQNLHWEIEKRDGEIAVLKNQITFLSEALEMERAWIGALSAQWSTQQGVLEAPQRRRG